jgi:hypothetical protein
MRATAQQCTNAEQFYHLVEVYGSGCGASKAEAQVGRNGHVWEQARILKDESHAPSLRGQPNTGCSIRERLSIDHDAALIGTQQTHGGRDDR